MLNGLSVIDIDGNQENFTRTFAAATQSLEQNLGFGVKKECRRQGAVPLQKYLTEVQYARWLDKTTIQGHICTGCVTQSPTKYIRPGTFYG